MALAEKRGRTLLELELEGSSFHEVVRILSDLPKNQYVAHPRFSLLFKNTDKIQILTKYEYGNIIIDATHLTQNFLSISLKKAFMNQEANIVR